MKTLQFGVCLIASSILFPLGACNKEDKVGFDSYAVSINNCGANPAWISVHEGNIINWQPNDQHDYTIRFSDRNEPTRNPFTLRHGGSNPARRSEGAVAVSR